jgi:RNA polymerase sigma-70 factor (ECF subfamily)
MSKNMKLLMIGVASSVAAPGVCPMAQMNSSENSMERVRPDDETFRLIFAQHHRFIFRFLYGMVGEHDLAEDLTQETFMRAYASMNTFRGESKLSTWLCGIAKNVALNTLRGRNREFPSIEINDQSVAKLSEGDGTAPDDYLLNKELRNVIHDALERLDSDKRMVFILKLLQQRSYDEIAEITGFSIPKLKTDLHRAKAEMRCLIRPYLEVRDEM